MVESFHTRIPTLPDAELQSYVRDPLAYKAEAVEAAVAELQRRGRPVSAEDLQRIRGGLGRRDAARHGSGFGRWLGATPERRRPRVRAVTALILALGLGAAAFQFATARPPGTNPLGYEPEDTKRYLRDLEMYGGKANVLATQFRRWFDGLWQGRPLAYTLASMTILLAGGFWFVASPAGPEPPEDASSGGSA